VIALKERPVAFILLGALTLALLYWLPARRWFARWGSAATDLTRVMAGDAAVVDPTYSATRRSPLTPDQNTFGRGWCKWAISEAGCIATTGSIVCSGISIAKAQTPSWRSFSNWPSVTRFPLDAVRDSQ